MPSDLPYYLTHVQGDCNNYIGLLNEFCQKRYAASGYQLKDIFPEYENISSGYQSFSYRCKMTYEGVEFTAVATANTETRAFSYSNKSLNKQIEQDSKHFAAEKVNFIHLLKGPTMEVTYM